MAEAVEHLLQATGVKPDHYLVADYYDWYNTPFSYLDHFLQCLTVLADVIFSEFNAFLRKELLRFMTKMSRGRRIYLYE